MSDPLKDICYSVGPGDSTSFMHELAVQRIEYVNFKGPRNIYYLFKCYKYNMDNVVAYRPIGTGLKFWVEQ